MTNDMKTLQITMIIISFGLLSCNNKSEIIVKNENGAIETISIDTMTPQQQRNEIVSDTIKRLKVDDYPVTNEMLADKTKKSSYEKQSGQTYSYSKVWFSNDSLNQTLVFELYTDYHRMVTYHFYSNDIPTNLIDRMELHIDGGDFATDKQKRKDFGGFLKQTTKITSSNFISDKGFKLGDTKEKAIKLYGTADEQTTSNGFEKLEWKFIGDNLYDGKEDLKDKPLAQGSWGHQVIMFFKNNKLAGQILYNDIP